jgi:hypothetical protein
LKGRYAKKKEGINFITESMIVEYNLSLITKEKIKERPQKSDYKFSRIAM